MSGVTFVAEAHATTSYTTTMTVNKPTGTADGDLLIAVLGGGTALPTVLTGWTALGSGVDTTGGTSVGKVLIMWKVASGEPASYSWTLTGSGGVMSCAGIMCYGGVNQANPVDKVNFSYTAYTAGGTSMPQTGITCNGMQVSMAFAIQYTFGNATPFTWTEGSGMERADFGVSSAAPDQASLNYNDDLNGLHAAGAVGRGETCSSAASLGAVGIMLINPAPLKPRIYDQSIQRASLI